MQKSVSVFAVLALGIILVLGSAVDLAACGDKYLSVGRGTKFQRGYVSVRPVSIAVLRQGASGQKDFLARLKLAGHRVEVIENIEELGARLTSSRFDVVLADYSDAVAVNRSIARSGSLFLPVVDTGSPHAATAHKEYGCLLSGKSKSKQRSFLAVLDEVVASSAKGEPVQCDLKKL